MDERSSRTFVGLCMLALVWIGVYWMWQPSQDRAPPITFGSHPSPEPTSGPAPERSPPGGPRDKPTGPQTIISQITRPDVETPAAEPAEQPALIPPEFTEHVVQPGEVMQTIARSYFGSVDDWPAIAKANPRVDPQKLRAGMVLRIPRDKGNIQGRVTGTPGEPGVISPPVRTSSKVIEYVVRPGDSLSVIAQRIYGSSRHARFIFESNRGTLSSMDSIAVGQLLKLPPLPEPADSSASGS